MEQRIVSVIVDVPKITPKTPDQEYLRLQAKPEIAEVIRRYALLATLSAFGEEVDHALHMPLEGHGDHLRGAFSSKNHSLSALLKAGMCACLTRTG